MRPLVFVELLPGVEPGLAHVAHVPGLPAGVGGAVGGQGGRAGELVAADVAGSPEVRQEGRLGGVGPGAGGRRRRRRGGRHPVVVRAGGRRHGAEGAAPEGADSGGAASAASTDGLAGGRLRWHCAEGGGKDGGNLV